MHSAHQPCFDGRVLREALLAMGKKGKTPKAPRQNPQGAMRSSPSSPQERASAGKVPQAVEDGSFYARKPAWRIGQLELVDPFGWHAVSRDDLDRIRQRLASFESMTWSQILVDGEKQNHSVRVSDLQAYARRRLDELKILQDELISLRVTGKERIWGYPAGGGTLTVLWWDPEHQVCRSIKKHT